MKKLGYLTSFLFFATLAGSVQAMPMNFSFSGNFTQDDDVQFFNFTADGSSEVFLVSYGYGGGTQADGSAHLAGGLDTWLSLFDSTGLHIGDNDDGGEDCFTGATAVATGTANGNADPNTSAMYDTCFSSMLTAGNYTVAVTQYDNGPNGNLGDGFSQDGQGNFTGTLGGCTNAIFCDVSNIDPFNNRTSLWAYDILNVGAAFIPNVPEPSIMALFGLGLLGLGFARRRKHS